MYDEGPGLRQWATNIFGFLVSIGISVVAVATGTVVELMYALMAVMVFLCFASSVIKWRRNEDNARRMVVLTTRKATSTIPDIVIDLEADLDGLGVPATAEPTQDAEVPERCEVAVSVQTSGAGQTLTALTIGSSEAVADDKVGDDKPEGCHDREVRDQEAPARVACDA